jgi:signal transduction histidine kinase/CheY-like chemotaxis protein
MTHDIKAPVAQLPASVDAHLRARLIDNARPLVFVRDVGLDNSPFSLLTGDPRHYGHDSSDLSRLHGFIDALRVGRESRSTSYWPLVELPGGHPVNIHWFSEQRDEYIIFTDADLCEAELRQRQQAANELALSNHALARTIEGLQRRREELEAHTLSLAESQRLQRWLIDTLAHDVRTPLTAILGYAEVLRPAFEADESASRALAALKRNATLLTDLAEDLLAAAQQRDAMSGQSRAWSIAELGADVESIIRPQAELKGLALEVQLVDLEAQPVAMDRVRLQRILVNLVTNAVRYTQAGRILVHIELLASSLRLEVQDTGVGIERAYHDSVFDAHNAGAQQGRLGAGLGLSIVRTLVKELDGTIMLESEPGIGTTVMVTIPLASSAVDDGCAPGCLLELPGLSSGRVLVVDDDPTVTELMGMIIESTGLDAHMTNDPARALDLMRSVDPGLILIDHRMGAWDGISLIGQFRQAGYTGTVIMLSGDSGDDLRHAARQAGADLCLRKPLNVAALKQFLRTGWHPQSGSARAGRAVG